jgi:hypothetical protein
VGHVHGAGAVFHARFPQFSGNRFRDLDHLGPLRGRDFDPCPFHMHTWFCLNWHDEKGCLMDPV